MHFKRVLYSVVIVITIATGLFVRIKQAWFPNIVNLYLGDMLYAFMVYYIVSCIAINKNLILRSMIALLFCYCIEISQLYQAGWINEIRQTIPGKLILGSGFLWSDLLACFLGILAVVLVDNLWFSRHKI
ncbi:ribosomal maturation YjgA family protein [Flavobacterium cerinum]|uniref:ribosomal maturation YjgA family protein n=1 Tax=Flavobacterium cerinum TaxID=2502784 RepID=UPI0019D4A574|nr:DUF2809 domain-containing protein [Flavobacterium cerinum]